MSDELQFAQWALKVANEALGNETAPRLFWVAFRQDVKTAIESLNQVFQSEEVEYIFWEGENSIRIRYRNCVLIVSIDFRTGRIQFHITLQSLSELVDEVYNGFLKLRLQIGKSSILKADESSIDGFSTLTPESLHFWPLHTRLSQFLLQKLVAPELNDVAFVGA